MLNRIQWAVRLSILLLSIRAVAQNEIGLIYLQPGTETIKSYVLENSGRILRKNNSGKSSTLTILPREIMKHHPMLRGISDFDSDGMLEIFISWLINPDLSHIQVYRVNSSQAAKLMLESQIHYTPVTVLFPVLPQRRKINAAIIAGVGGAYWDAYFAVFPGRNKFVNFGTGSGLQLGDLDGNGTFEWIQLQWRGFDPTCHSYVPGPGRNANIFRLSGEKFVKVWPPSGWVTQERDPGNTCVVMSKLFDMDGDGGAEIVAITDIRENPHPRLSIYKSGFDHFACIASADIPSKYIATEIIGIRRLKDRKQVVLRMAQAAKCLSDSYRGFDFKDGRLAQSWINDKIRADLDIQGVAKDIDGDGEEEMIFKEVDWSPPRPPKTAPILLKGIKDFSPYALPK
jgi:hypothetical protein